MKNINSILKIELVDLYLNLALGSAKLSKLDKLRKLSKLKQPENKLYSLLNKNKYTKKRLKYIGKTCRKSLLDLTFQLIDSDNPVTKWSLSECIKDRLDRKDLK